MRENVRTNKGKNNNKNDYLNKMECIIDNLLHNYFYLKVVV